MVEPTYRPGVLSESGLLPAITGTGSPVTLEEIKRRRAIAAALATRSRPFPTTIGQGLTSLGEAFGDVMAERRLNEQEAALNKQIGAPPPVIGAGAAAPPPTAAPVAPPVAAAPVGRPPPMLTPAAPSAADPRDLIARAVAEREGIAGPTPPQPAREVASSGPTEAGASALPPVSPTATASAPPSPTAGGDDPLWAARQGAIEGIESRGAADPYRAVGDPTKYGRGLGRYQVVEANVAPWTQAALGQALTPQQFLASPQAQDAVFKHRFGQYVDQFGEEGAARAWFGGPGNVNKTDLTDTHKKLSIGDYGKSYMEGLKAGTDPTQIAAYAPSGVATDAPPIGARSGMAIPPLTEENPVTPSDIMPVPTRVAQAGGVVPGAAAAPTPSRGAASGAAPAEYRPPEPVPPAPLKRIEPTEREAWAIRALGINPEHTLARQIYTQEEADRKFMEQREVERYTREITDYELQKKEKRAWEAGEEDRKIARETHRQALQKQQEANAVTAAYGNLPEPVRKHLEDSTVSAKTAAGAIEATRDARLAMDAGTVFGFGADAKLQAYRAAAAAGNADAQRIVAATQTFKTNLGPIIQATIKSYAGKDVSTSELKFAQGMAGADISLDRDAAERTLKIAERAANETLRNHRETVDTMLKGQRPTAHPALRSLYGVREPLAGVPVPTTALIGSIIDVRSEEEANNLPPGSRFRLNGRTGTVR